VAGWWLVQVLGVGQMVPQHRPQVVVLGGVVYLQGLTERGPALGHGSWPAVPAFELGGEGLEAGRVTAQPGMDGPHEAKVGRAVVVASLGSPPAPAGDEDRRAGRDDQEQHRDLLPEHEELGVLGGLPASEQFEPAQD